MVVAVPQRSQEELDSARKAARTLVQFAYEALRQDILSGALAPGAKLRAEVLKDHYQVGPRPCARRCRCWWRTHWSRPRASAVFG